MQPGDSNVETPLAEVCGEVRGRFGGDSASGDGSAADSVVGLSGPLALQGREPAVADGQRLAEATVGGQEAGRGLVCVHTPESDASLINGIQRFQSGKKPGTTHWFGARGYQATAVGSQRIQVTRMVRARPMA